MLKESNHLQFTYPPVIPPTLHEKNYKNEPKTAAKKWQKTAKNLKKRHNLHQKNYKKKKQFLKQNENFTTALFCYKPTLNISVSERKKLKRNIKFIAIFCVIFTKRNSWNPTKPASLQQYFGLSMYSFKYNFEKKNQNQKKFKQKNIYWNIM